MKPFPIWALVNDLYEILQLIIGGLFFVAATHAILKNEINYITFFFFFFGLGCVAWTLASETFGRKFDKYFADKLGHDPDFILRASINMQLPPNIVGKFRLIRTTIYCREIILRRNLKKKRNMDSRWFGDFDFRKNATWFEILLAHGVAISFLLMVVSVLWPTISGLLQHI